MFWQMSTAMMSAPSSAIRTAWDLPWPRAAPVMKATLPSSLPAIVVFLSRGTGVPWVRGDDRDQLGRQTSSVALDNTELLSA